MAVMTRWVAIQRSHDRGAAEVVAMVAIAPLVIAVALLMVALGRGVDASTVVRSAAFAGAQAAALERTPSSAQAVAEHVVLSALDQNPHCVAPEVIVDVSAFGPGGMVSVMASCTPREIGVDAVDSLRRESGWAHGGAVGLWAPVGTRRVAVATAVVDRFRFSQPLQVGT